jgi:hypothetical protein
MQMWASSSGRFIPGERVPGIHWIGIWTGNRTRLDVVAKKTIPPLQGIETWTSTSWPVICWLRYPSFFAYISHVQTLRKCFYGFGAHINFENGGMIIVCELVGLGKKQVWSILRQPEYLQNIWPWCSISNTSDIPTANVFQSLTTYRKPNDSINHRYRAQKHNRKIGTNPFT